MSSNSIADKLKEMGYPSMFAAENPKTGHRMMIPQTGVDAAQKDGYQVQRLTYMNDGKSVIAVPLAGANKALKDGWRVGIPIPGDKQVPVLSQTVDELANQALAQNPKSKGLSVAPARLPQQKMRQVDVMAGALTSQPPMEVPENEEGDSRTRLPWDLVGDVKVGADRLTETPRQGARLAGQYIQSEAESMDPSSMENPGVAQAYKNVIAPVGKASSRFIEGQYEPRNLALLGAFKFLPQTTAATRLVHSGSGVALGAPMVQGAIQQGTQGVQQLADGNTPEGVENLAGAAFDTAFAADTLGGVARGARQSTRDLQTVGKQAIETRPAQSVVRGAKKTGEVIGSGARTVQAYWNPEKAMTAEQAATKAFRPRNSKTNWNQEVASALPDARRAADTLGYNPEQMSLEEAMKSVQQAKKDVWSEYKQNFLDPAAQSSATVDGNKIADAMVGSITERMRTQNPATARAIEAKAATYRGKQLTVEQAQDFLSEANNETRAIEARYVTDKRAAKNDPRNAYKFAERDTLRTELNGVLDSVAGEGGQALRKRWGALNSLEDVISRRIPVADRQSPESLPKTLAKMYAAGRLARGVFSFNPADILEGGVSLLSQRRSGMLNDPDFLTSLAFKKTQPTGPALTPTEYMPEPGAYNATVPRFLRPALPASTRDRGVPGNPVVDPVNNREYGDSVTPLGTRGQGGVLVRPAGMLPAPEVQTPAVQTQRRALPPISLFQQATMPRINAEVPNAPSESAAELQLRNRMAVSHPDIPDGQVVGVDADTGLPIVKRSAQEAIQDAGLVDRGPQPGSDLRYFEHPEVGGKVGDKFVPTTMALPEGQITLQSLLESVAKKAKDFGIEVPPDVQSKLETLRPESQNILAQLVQQASNQESSNGRGSQIPVSEPPTRGAAEVAPDSSVAGGVGNGVAGQSTARVSEQPAQRVEPSVSSVEPPSVAVQPSKAGQSRVVSKPVQEPPSRKKSSAIPPVLKAGRKKPK